MWPCTTLGGVGHLKYLFGRHHVLAIRGSAKLEYRLGYPFRHQALGFDCQSSQVGAVPIAHLYHIFTTLRECVGHPRLNGPIPLGVDRETTFTRHAFHRFRLRRGGVGPGDGMELGGIRIVFA